MVMDNGRPTRHSRHRDQVRAALRETSDFRSAQAVHAMLRERGTPIGLTTVYRILQAFAGDGEVDSARNSAGEQVYRHCSPGSHHHLMCRSCARVVEVPGPAVEQWATAAAKRHGFSDVNHRVEIFGTCRACAALGPEEHA
jgi:Fur family ferric uptake transcriptional regulator